MKRKVNIDREKPSAEEIRSRKDFQSVLKEYSATAGSGVSSKPFLKSTGFLIGALISLVAAIAVLSYSKFSSKTTGSSVVSESKQDLSPEGVVQVPISQDEQSGTRKIIAPPLKNVDVPFQEYKLNASKGGEFTSKNGSTIHVPQNAFADAQGNILQGEVDLRFREFRDPVDFFVSGIPMSYDSAGKKYQFESGGMVEVTGYKDSKPIQIASGKKVDVRLMSVSSGRSYNLYKLDTASGNWVYIGKDVAREKTKAEIRKQPAAEIKKNDTRQFESRPEIVEIDKKLEEAVQLRDKAIAQLQALPSAPLKPQKANPMRHRFNIDVDSAEFPEMKQYKSMVFEVGTEPENKEFSSDMYKTTWDDIQLAEGSKKGINYCLTLKKGLETKKVIVYPVFVGKEYQAALKNFNSRSEAYNSLKDQNTENEKKIRRDCDSRLADLKRQREKKEAAWKEEQNVLSASKQHSALADSLTGSPLEREVVRSFSLSHFGIYNCDCPIALPAGAEISIRVTDEAGKDLGSASLYLVDKKINGLFKYYSKAYTSFQFDPGSKNMAWTVVGGKMYVIREMEFSKLHTSGQDVLHMTAINREFKDAAEIRSFLGI